MAFRASDRKATADLIQKLLGYKVATTFDIVFDDGSKTESIALVPPEKMDNVPSIEAGGRRHLAPEIFVSDGEPDSIVGKWVNKRGGKGGIHHIAYQVFNIDRIVKEWRDKGVEFLSEEVIDCPDDDLRQIFTKPLDCLGGMIIELIERGDKGFCQNSVKSLMESTEDAK
jgi:hypothetical protein